VRTVDTFMREPMLLSFAQYATTQNHTFN